jgi:hypothetical protein
LISTLIGKEFPSSQEAEGPSFVKAMTSEGKQRVEKKVLRCCRLKKKRTAQRAERINRKVQGFEGARFQGINSITLLTQQTQ